MSSSKSTALITGASSGIGAVYAERLAARGHDLILIARRTERLQALAAELSAAHGTSVQVVGADLTQEDDLRRVEQILATDPKVSLLINNAGNGKLGATTAMSDQDFTSTVALNVTALARLCRAVLPPFMSRNAGSIINISSAVALHTLSITSLYSATKSFVLSFSRGLQEELAGHAVKVQVVLPAGTATEFYDHSGIPLSAFDPDAVMSTENMVDAALTGFDQGEKVTIPSLADLQLWESYETARNALFGATQTGKPASRYLAK